VLVLLYNMDVAELRYIIGVDEVGRGPLAGPVTVGAVAVPIHLIARFKDVRDSKKLTPTKREEWRERVHEAGKDGMRWAVASSSSSIIDGRGLTYAIRKALHEAIRKLAVDPEHCIVLLDGGLKAPERWREQRTIIKGDEKEPAIALASIIAKVHRDRVMERWSLVYPDHGFHVHKGYGTRAHYLAIKKKGITPIHRRSFLSGLK
jgi:ribonuclease HII